MRNGHREYESTLVRQLAEFAQSVRWETVPEDVRARATDRILDAFSTAVASRNIDVTRAALASLDSPDGGPCTVLPTGASSTQGGAAFANGVAVHAILFEDIHMASADHPGAVVVPAALAGAEAAARVVGRVPFIEDLVIATLVGYEVQLHLGAVAARGVRARGFRTTSVFGVAAAAAAIASVWRLPQEQTANAVGLAGNFAFGLLEGWAHGTMEPYLHAGMAARAGGAATMLARSGAVAAPTTLEGQDGFLRAFADVTGGVELELGRQWRILDVVCKPYPISGAKLTAVDSALAARERLLELARTPDDIERVVVHISELAFTFPGGDRAGPFRTMTQAQDSTLFCVCAALLGRSMTVIDTFSNGFQDEEVAALTHRVELVRGAPDRELGLIEVTLRDGTVISEEVDWRDRHEPSLEKMEQKLLSLTAKQWAPGTAEGVIDLLETPANQSIVSLSRLLRR